MSMMPIEKPTQTVEHWLVDQMKRLPCSEFHGSIEKYFLPFSKIELEQLSDVKDFIEKYAFPKGRQANLRDPRIQSLFDHALARAIRADCDQLLAKYEDRETSRRVSAEKSQQEAYRWQQKGHWGQLEAAMIQGYRKMIQQESEIYETEDADIVVVETAETREQKIVTLLKNWKEEPFLMLRFTSVEERIDYLRNTLLPKADQILLDPGWQRIQNPPPALRFKRIS